MDPIEQFVPVDNVLDVHPVEDLERNLAVDPIAPSDQTGFTAASGSDFMEALGSGFMPL